MQRTRDTTSDQNSFFHINSLWEIFIIYFVKRDFLDIIFYKYKIIHFRLVIVKFNLKFKALIMKDKFLLCIDDTDEVGYASSTGLLAEKIAKFSRSNKFAD